MALGEGRARLWVTGTHHRRLSTGAAGVQHYTGPGLVVTSPEGQTARTNCGEFVHRLWTMPVQSVAMTAPLTGQAAAISHMHATARAVLTTLGYVACRVAEAAAEDPDAAEAGPLMSAVLAFDVAAIALDDAARALSEACHAAHTTPR